LLKVAQRYSSLALCLLGPAVLCFGLFHKPHHDWLQDCGTVIILISFGMSLFHLHAQALEVMSAIPRFRQVCDLYKVPVGYLNTVYRWLWPFMVTTLILSLTFLVAAMIFRTNYQSLRFVSSSFTILSVLGNVIFQTRPGSILRKLESLAPSRVASPPMTAKFILLLIPKRHREHLIGDLEEEYRTILLPEYGARKARNWYWWQVAISVGPLLWAQIKRGAAMAWLWKRVR
jgi:hypothetical protein